MGLLHNNHTLLFHVNNMTVSLVNIDPRTEETMILTATRACLLLLASTSVVGAWTAPSTFPQQRTAAGTTNNDILYATNKDEWSIADDWNELSAENPLNSAPNSQDIFNQNIGQKATQSILPDNHGEQMEEWSAEDRWVHDIIDQFQNPISTSPLYDTGSSKEDDFLTKNKNFEEHMGDEIAMLVRCNESPEDMLVRAGRAVPELPEEQKMDASQLVIWRDSLGSHEEGFWEATPFLHQAVKTIFHLHAADDNQEEVTMDAKAVSRWMTQSLGDELDSYTERAGKDMTSFRQTKTIKIGPHDSRVLKVISKYGTYGTGKINLQSFQQVYLDALTHMDTGMELKGSVETLHLRNGDHIRQVWRDFKNHGIVGPNEQKWKEAHTQLEAQYGSLQEQTRKFLEKGSDIFMDECEILDYNYNPPPTPEQVAEGYDAKNHKYIRKSSHEQVALAPDNQTPLYMEEGSFVFIDEESCIGCMQCVNVAPDSFLMMETGRARTFHQRSGADVDQGVAACPVSCMHRVSFDELKELETARDKGDGRKDHQHMGHRRGYTPLHVARRGSDNNHRSSWYHYMKNKCCSSGQCPQRGCYDCPSFPNPGDNPYFQKRVKEAQHSRAQYFTDSGEADLWRRTADL